MKPKGYEEFLIETQHILVTAGDSLAVVNGFVTTWATEVPVAVEDALEQLKLIIADVTEILNVRLEWYHAKRPKNLF